MDDPDFWMKLFPNLANVPDPNIRFDTRVRKQTQRLGAKDLVGSDSEEPEPDSEYDHTADTAESEKVGPDNNRISRSYFLEIIFE